MVLRMLRADTCGHSGRSTQAIDTYFISSVVTKGWPFNYIKLPTQLNFHA